MNYPQFNFSFSEYKKINSLGQEKLSKFFFQKTNFSIDLLNEIFDMFSNVDGHF